MSNKTDLQENNVKLQTIKNNIEELPESNAWTGQTSIVPGTQAITIPAYTDKELTIQGDVNLIAANIAKGKTIFGVKGKANTSLADFGVDFGEVVMTAGNTEVIKINHSLGAVPRKVVFTMTEYDYEAYTRTVMYDSGGHNNGSYVCGLDVDWIPHDSSKHAITVNAQSFSVYANMSLTADYYDRPFESGETYLWIAVK